MSEKYMRIIYMYIFIFWKENMFLYGYVNFSGLKIYLMIIF